MSNPEKHKITTMQMMQMNSDYALGFEPPQILRFRQEIIGDDDSIDEHQYTALQNALDAQMEGGSFTEALRGTVLEEAAIDAGLIEKLQDPLIFEPVDVQKENDESPLESIANRENNARDPSTILGNEDLVRETERMTRDPISNLQKIDYEAGLRLISNSYFWPKSKDGITDRSIIDRQQFDYVVNNSGRGGIFIHESDGSASLNLSQLEDAFKNSGCASIPKDTGDLIRFIYHEAGISNDKHASSKRIAVSRVFSDAKMLFTEEYKKELYPGELANIVLGLIRYGEQHNGEAVIPKKTRDFLKELKTYISSAKAKLGIGTGFDIIYEEPETEKKSIWQKIKGYFSRGRKDEISSKQNANEEHEYPPLMPAEEVKRNLEKQESWTSYVSIIRDEHGQEMPVAISDALNKIYNTLSVDLDDEETKSKVDKAVVDFVMEKGRREGDSYSLRDDLFGILTVRCYEILNETPAPVPSAGVIEAIKDSDIEEKTKSVEPGSDAERRRPISQEISGEGYAGRFSDITDTISRGAPLSESQMELLNDIAMGAPFEFSDTKIKGRDGIERQRAEANIAYLNEVAELQPEDILGRAFAGLKRIFLDREYDRQEKPRIAQEIYNEAEETAKRTVEETEKAAQDLMHTLSEQHSEQMESLNYQISQYVAENKKLKSEVRKAGEKVREIEGEKSRLEIEVETSRKQREDAERRLYKERWWRTAEKIEAKRKKIRFYAGIGARVLVYGSILASAVYLTFNTNNPVSDYLKERKAAQQNESQAQREFFESDKELYNTATRVLENLRNRNNNNNAE